MTLCGIFKPMTYGLYAVLLCICEVNQVIVVPAAWRLLFLCTVGPRTMCLDAVGADAGWFRLHSC